MEATIARQEGREHRIGSVATAAAAMVVFALAFAARLLPVLRGGGLTGVLGYDAGVYYGAALAFVDGRMPYRDFLLLHPPGIVVALAPFAALAHLTSEVFGFAVADVAWMLLGSLTAVLVLKVLRPLGLGAAIVGGACYAVFPPAVQVERTTLLEGLANLCLVGALVLICRRASARPLLAACGAGVLLGVSSSVKIWGVVPLLIVFVYVLVTAGLRVAIVLLSGAAGAISAICGPFFLAAPRDMWRMVVLDQMGRPRTAQTLLSRLNLMTTLGVHPQTVAGETAILVVCGLVVIASVLTLSQPLVRVASPLLLGIAIMLLVTPSFFAHYAAAAAVPLAVVMGAAAGVLAKKMARLRWIVVAVPLAVGVSLLAVDGKTLLALRAGKQFPSAALAAVVQPATGCITADDPSTLIQLDVLGRNIERHCDVVVDLGGYSYDVSRGLGLSRAHDPAWQRLALDYLRSGDLSITTRFSRHFGLSASTSKTIHRWPERAVSGKIVVRRPSPGLVAKAR